MTLKQRFEAKDYGTLTFKLWLVPVHLCQVSMNE